PASDTSLAAAPAQQNKSTIVRLRSFVCIADDAPEKRVNMSSPEYYINAVPMVVLLIQVPSSTKEGVIIRYGIK
ncbi:hypothetical protein, partial [Escherichia coli]